MASVFILDNLSDYTRSFLMEHGVTLKKIGNEYIVGISDEWDVKSCVDDSRYTHYVKGGLLIMTLFIGDENEGRWLELGGLCDDCYEYTSSDEYLTSEDEGSEHSDEESSSGYESLDDACPGG